MRLHVDMYVAVLANKGQACGGWLQQLPAGVRKQLLLKICCFFYASTNLPQAVTKRNYTTTASYTTTWKLSSHSLLLHNSCLLKVYYWMKTVFSKSAKYYYRKLEAVFSKQYFSYLRFDFFLLTLFIMAKVIKN